MEIYLSLRVVVLQPITIMSVTVKAKQLLLLVLERMQVL